MQRHVKDDTSARTDTTGVSGVAYSEYSAEIGANRRYMVHLL